MSTLGQKLRQLEQATATSELLLAEKESELSSASEALRQAKSRLRSLSPEAQSQLQVNDTELPELISAKMRAQEARDEAKARHETNEKYVSIFRGRVAEDSGA